MSNFIERRKNISGRMVIDGTLEAKHIKANTITANKFSGAVEEEYWAYLDDKDISFAYSGYTTALEFTFPKTELDIFKGRHVHYCGANRTDYNRYRKCKASNNIRLISDCLL
jgi:hypothetical protein